MDTNEELPVPPIEPEKTELIQVNFKNGTIVDKIQFDEDGGIPKAFRELAKFAKKNKVKSTVVLTIDEANHVDWIHIADSEHHLALAALCMDDIREEIKDRIFGLEEE